MSGRSPRVSSRGHGDGALSDIVGTTLLVAMAVVLASTFTVFMLQMPGPIDTPHANLLITLDKGAGGWGSGDEQVRILHQGGSPLIDRESAILVVIDDAHARYSGGTLGSAFSDGSFSIGESWRKNLTIAAASVVRVSVIADLGEGSRVLASSMFSATDCSSDTTGPVAASILQSPGNVTSATSGPVLLTLVVADACAGVDDAATPLASYRINDGTNPSFVSLGAMTSAGPSTWSVSIPDPTWSARVNETLQYVFSGLTDLNGNVASTDVTNDVIEFNPCAGDITPPTSVLAGLPANLTMNTTGTVRVTLTASDACSGVDDSHQPVLEYRVNDGSDPAFTSIGTMTLNGTHTWEGTIPDAGWLANRGRTLQFRAGTIADLVGNTATSATTSDLIDNPCESDTLAPTATFTQTPANVSATTSSTVTVDATLSDACAGVDATVTPHLYHRINDGTNPAFTDAGPMSNIGPSAWRGTVPNPVWLTQAGKTLEYRMGPVTDRFGNTGTSATQSDFIEATDPCAGDLTAPTGAFTQTPVDLTMNATGPVTVNLTATDDCSGVNDATTPRIQYRVDNGTAPAYTDGGPMSLVGTHQWQATLPDLGWLSARGASLQYYASGVADANGNTGNTAVASDLIDNPCSTDNAPPTATWTQSPANVTTHTATALTLVASLSDACAGVDPASTPHLHYRLDDGTSPAFTDLGPMTSMGSDQWQATLPNLGWSSAGGRTLQYYATPLADRFANSAASSTRSDLVDIIVTSTYVTTNTTTRGSVMQFGNAQAANGLEAQITEAANTSGTASTVLQPTNIASSSFVPSPSLSMVSSSNNVYAKDGSANAGSTLRVGLGDPVGTPGIIVSLVIKAEVAIEAPAAKGGLDAFTLAACMTTCGVASPQLGASLNSDVIVSYNVTTAGTLHPNGNSTWTWDDVRALEAVLTTVKNNAADGSWRVDHMSVEVVYSPTTYDVNVRFDFAGVPTGTQHVLELRYRTSGDTFRVEVWNGTAFNTRGSTLSAGSLTLWSYPLTTAEWNGGAPRIRFIDATPLGTTQGNLYLDYARVVSS